MTAEAPGPRSDASRVRRLPQRAAYDSATVHAILDAGMVGHAGFVTDAQAMAALLFDFATRADYRAAVKKEFDGIKALFAEYQDALRKTYVIPRVPVP